MSVASPSAVVTVDFPQIANEQCDPTLWLASWLYPDGSEGDWFYSGRGGESVAVEPPTDAGIRVRRWVSDGLPPEYADIPGDARRLSAGDLDFNMAGPHTRLDRTPPQ